jgi:transcription antitermination factor NusG
LNAGIQTSYSPDSAVLIEQTAESWYAVHTRAQHEKAVAHRLRERGVTTFLPTFTEVHRWKDRRKTVELPLFSCYLFVKLMPCNEDRQRVLRTAPRVSGRLSPTSKSVQFKFWSRGNFLVALIPFSKPDNVSASGEAPWKVLKGFSCLGTASDG